MRQKVAYHFKSSFSGYKIAAMLLVEVLWYIAGLLSIKKEASKLLLQKRGRKVGSGRLLDPRQEEKI
jgi:hypothetical protein